MKDVWVRFFSALAATGLSIFCFSRGGKFVDIWWQFVHATITLEVARQDENGFQFVVYNFFFLWLVAWQPYIPQEVMLALLFTPLISAIFTHQNFVKSTGYVLNLVWITIPCYIGHKLSEDVSFIVGFLCVVWFMDAGAYFSGHLFGRTPLLANISPKKTVEGTLGGAVVTQVVAFIVSFYVPHIAYKHWIVIGIISSTVGQAGDLFESMYKRSLNMKDSGIIMPGHGGFLDRFDAVLFSVIFTNAYLRCIQLI